MQLDLFKLEEEVVYTDPTVRHKACTDCGCIYPETIDYFNYGVRHKDGKEYFKSTCRPCSNKADRIRYRLREQYKDENKGVCHCCGIHESELKNKLQLDHCVETGRYRGWLCSSCNQGMGQFGDRIEGLELAISYLRRHYDGQP